MENYFKALNAINVKDHVEKKNGLSYLSWAWAWQEVKKVYPDTNYTIYENKDGWNYFTDGKTCWVKTGVTINGLEHIEYLPVMDNRNRSIALDNVTSFDVNKAIQRSLTKACARHGLGLYIYAGEDLPEEEKTERKNDGKKVVVNVKDLEKEALAPEEIKKHEDRLPWEEGLDDEVVGDIVFAAQKAGYSQEYAEEIVSKRLNKESLYDLTVDEANKLIAYFNQKAGA